MCPIQYQSLLVLLDPPDGIFQRDNSIITAAQAQTIGRPANYFKKNILKQEIESKYRLCKEYEETVDHLTLGCPTL
jgi:hypothetical protein